MKHSGLSVPGRLLVTVCTAALLTLYAGMSTAAPSSGTAAAVLVLLVALLALPVFLLGRGVDAVRADRPRGLHHLLAVALALSALVLAHGAYTLLDRHRLLAVPATFVVSALATAALLALDHRIAAWSSSFQR